MGSDVANKKATNPGIFYQQKRSASNGYDLIKGHTVIVLMSVCVSILV
jgi:hypothetical protein